MIDRAILRKRNETCWEIPMTYRSDMRVPCLLFASEKMLLDIFGDRSIEQLVNVTTLPGIQKAALAMPDIHEGYGFPIGGVAAVDFATGVVSPGGIGYDINCGVRLLSSTLSFDTVKGMLDQIGKELFLEIPSGVGRGGRLKLDRLAMDEVLQKGVDWLLEKGYGGVEDKPFLESMGRLPQADAGTVSEHAKKRGMDQVGTIGAGNHFVEVDRVETIFDVLGADAFGLHEGQIVVLIHTGSRGLGHQVATDYIRVMLEKLSSYGIVLPDRELACAPITSVQGKEYLGAMAAAANFAFANRQMIAFEVRMVFHRLFGNDGKLRTIYDVAHNIAKIEEHTVGRKKKKLLVHRKGATRAFGPFSAEIPATYQEVGQPVLIPGSMGTHSYVLRGTEKSSELSFGSACHGAGRRMSRHAAKKTVSGRVLFDTLLASGIHVRAGSMRDLPEEGPLAYKDVDEVVSVMDRSGIAKKVARLTPLVVIKG